MPARCKISALSHERHNCPYILLTVYLLSSLQTSKCRRSGPIGLSRASVMAEAR